jgi:hypothetical protein
LGKTGTDGKTPHYIALFKKESLSGLAFNWKELEPEIITTPADISALDTITIDGKKQLVYIAGRNLYLQAPTLSATAKNLGIVSDSHAIAIGDINMDGISDIAVADYHQV